MKGEALTGRGNKGLFLPSEAEPKSSCRRYSQLSLSQAYVQP